jgi:hypothetical protein
MKNLLPCVLLVVELGNVADLMGHTSGAAKYGKLLNLLDEGMAMGGVDFSKVKEEAAAVLKDAAKKAELLAEVNKKLDLADDKLEALIEKGLSIVEKQIAIVKEAIELSKELKA